MMDEAFLQDLFSSIGPVTVKKMFGGQGIYASGKIIAITINDGTLHLKGDAQSSPLYEQRGMTQWVYTAPKTGKSSARPYWRVPDSALDDATEMAELASMALETATRAAKKT